MKDRGNLILFCESKNELFRLSDGLKSLGRKLKTQWKISSFKDDITRDTFQNTGVVIIGCPRQKFTQNQISHLRRHVEEGGGLFIMMEEGGEKKAQTNINFLLEEFGIAFNNDAVIRTSFYKYFHPKECFILNGVLNRAILESTGRNFSISHNKNDYNQLNENIGKNVLSFVYPFGCTVNVQKPAVAVLSTGSVSYPLNRPVCAFFEHSQNGGRVVALGSGHLLSDQYIDKEDNSKIKDVIFSFLTAEFKLNQIDAEDPEVTDYNLTPDLSYLSENVKSCLLESDELPSDFVQIFDSTLSAVDMEHVPDAIEAYAELNIKHEPLKLITPQFEAPLPPLQPAIFPPTFKELSHPPLELYDLDEAFSSEKSRLAQLTNKCKDEDLEYYVRECGDVVGVSPNLPVTSRDAKHVLEYILMQLSEFKKINQEFNYDQNDEENSL